MQLFCKVAYRASALAGLIICEMESPNPSSAIARLSLGQATKDLAHAGYPAVKPEEQASGGTD